jgi:hypothetical protein
MSKLLSLWDSVPAIDDLEEHLPQSLDGIGISGTDPLQVVVDRVDMWISGFKEASG